MRALLITFLLMVGAVAQAETQVPSGVKCMKQAKSLGLSVVDAYQVCKVKSSIRSCILKQQKENKALAKDKKELASLGKAAIKKCQK
jgi:hypothetical protein